MGVPLILDVNSLFVLSHVNCGMARVFTTWESGDGRAWCQVDVSFHGCSGCPSRRRAMVTSTHLTKHSTQKHNVKVSSETNIKTAYKVP